MFCKRISTQASPSVKFPTCKLQIASEANHDTQTRPSTGNDRRPMFDTEPTSITTTVTHRKRKSYFSPHIQRCSARGFRLRHPQQSNFPPANCKYKAKLNTTPKPARQWGTKEGQFQLQLQNPKRANYNKTNRKTRTTTTSK
jgi:hypothetical protein